MKKINNKKIILTILSIIILSSAISVYAIEYVPLEPNAFPGVTSSASLGAYLGLIFNFGIAIAVVLSLVMIIWGGIMYMTTDSWSGKDEGKSKITNALYGLGLALVSWLLLYTINPDLVSFSKNTLLNPQQSTTQTP